MPVAGANDTGIGGKIICIKMNLNGQLSKKLVVFLVCFREKHYICNQKSNIEQL